MWHLLQTSLLLQIAITCRHLLRSIKHETHMCRCYYVYVLYSLVDLQITRLANLSISKWDDQSGKLTNQKIRKMKKLKCSPHAVNSHTLLSLNLMVGWLVSYICVTSPRWTGTNSISIVVASTTALKQWWRHALWMLKTEHYNNRWEESILMIM